MLTPDSTAENEARMRAPWRFLRTVFTIFFLTLGITTGALVALAEKCERPMVLEMRPTTEFGAPAFCLHGLVNGVSGALKPGYCGTDREEARQMLLKAQGTVERDYASCQARVGDPFTRPGRVFANLLGLEASNGE